MSDGPGLVRKEHVYEQFCFENGKYWTRRAHSETDSPPILIEGFFAESGPNYTIRVGSVAKALQEACGGRIITLLLGKATEESAKVTLWKSFSIDDFLFLREIRSNFPIRIRFKIALLSSAYFVFSQILLALGKGRAFLDLSYSGIRFGDLIYDEVLKIRGASPKIGCENYSIGFFSLNEGRLFLKTFIYVHALEGLLRKAKPRYYVSTHSQYLTYGFPARFFKARGLLVLETTDDFLFMYDEDSDRLPKFHQKISQMIGELERALSVEDSQSLIETGRSMLQARFGAKVEQIDVKMAFGDKVSYDPGRLRRKLGIDNEFPFVFIFAHVFADAPQGISDGSLFIDYHSWLEETLKHIRFRKDVNWIVKGHPSSRAYGEEAVVDRMVGGICGMESTVYVCPSDLNTACVKDLAHAVITAQGTAGLEFACFGIPVLITSRPFYSGFGFTLEPTDEQHYFSCLDGIKGLPRLSELQMEKAILVFQAFHSLIKKDYSLIDARVKDLTWGVGVDKDVLGAYELVTERLKKVNPRETPLYADVLSLVRKYHAEST